MTSTADRCISSETAGGVSPLLVQEVDALRQWWRELIELGQPNAGSPVDRPGRVHEHPVMH